MAVRFDRPSIVAMHRAATLAKALGTELSLLHVMSPDEDVSEACRAEAILAWATKHISIDERAIVIRRGKPVGEIWREVNAKRAALLVIGGVVEGGEKPGWMVRFLAQHTRRPVLVASIHHEPEVVVGTDLSDRELPVLRCAEVVAAGLDAHVEPVFNQPPEKLDLADRSFVRPTVDLLGVPSKLDLACAETAAELDHVEVTHESAPWMALLRRARMHNADMVVVGARETSGHTLREILLRAQRSVLSVPLGLGAKLIH